MADNKKIISCGQNQWFYSFWYISFCMKTIQFKKEKKTNKKTHSQKNTKTLGKNYLHVISD